MIELGKNVAWTWDNPQISVDMAEMISFYGDPANREKLWLPVEDVPKVRVSCPRMLALPLDCMVFCATHGGPQQNCMITSFKYWEFGY